LKIMFTKSVHLDQIVDGLEAGRVGEPLPELALDGGVELASLFLGEACLLDFSLDLQEDFCSSV